MPFWADGWPSIAAADQGVVLQNTVRPFVYAPWAFARLLSPNVFASVNLIIAGAMFGKAFVLYLLLKRLTGNNPLAFAAAAILVVIPVDTSIFNEGTLSIHIALFCYLGAAYALVAYWQRPRWYWLLLMWLGLLVATGIYETVYPLLLFTPLMLLYGHPKISRRFIRVVLVWYVVPLLIAGRIALMMVQQQVSLSYQRNLFVGIDISASIGSLFRVYERHFYSGWEQSWGLLYGHYGILAGGIALIGLLFVSWSAGLLPKRRLLLLTVAGLAILGLGFAPYLVTALRDDTNRTYFYSSLGAAITIASVILLIVSFIPVRRFVYVCYAILIALIIGRGASVSLDRHQANINNGAAQIPFLRAITTQVSAFAPDTLLVVIDDSGDHALGNTFVYSSYYFSNALRVLYQNSTLIAAFCYPQDEGTWGIFNEQCRFEPRGVTGADVKQPNSVWSYDQVVAFHYAPDGTLTLLNDLRPYVADAVDYDPNRLLNDDALPTARISSMLGELSENSP